MPGIVAGAPASKTHPMTDPTICENCHERPVAVYIVDGCDDTTADWCSECLREHEDIVGEWHSLEPTTDTEP